MNAENAESLTAAFNDLHEKARTRENLPRYGSQVKMANRLEVTAGHYNDVLSGRTGTASLLVKWAGILGYSVEFLPDGSVTLKEVASAAG